MAACDIQTLLTNGRCFAALPSGLLNAVTAQLWCQVAEGISNLDNPNPSIQSLDNGLWYRTGGVSVGGGEALFWMTQVETAAGPNPELVITAPATGDKYKVQAWGVPPNVQWQVDPTPTGDPETPTQIAVASITYDLVIRIDGSPLPVLEPV